jgi:hypothetical protein
MFKTRLACSGASCFGFVPLAHSDLFRISDFVLRIWGLALGAIWLGGVALVGAATPTNNAASASPPPPKDTLAFLNGDILRGSFLSFDAKGGVRWQNSCIKPVLTMDVGGVSQVTLSGPKAQRKARPDCVARLTNGDELMGSLVALDEKELTLDTWYAGPLTLSRPGLAALSLDMRRLNVIYEGPTSPDGWTFKGNNLRATAPGKTPLGWQYKDEAFYGFGTGSVGRDVKLPRLSSLEFEMAWRGPLQLILFFYTDNLESYGGNTYGLQFGQRNISLQRQIWSGNSSDLGSLEVPALGRNQARLALHTDRENRTIALLIDDILVKQWTDSRDFNEAGTGVQFCLQGGPQAVKVSNLRVTAWDGRLDDLPSAIGSPADDLVRLANNDKMSGTLKGIRAGKAQMTTPFANLELPLDRINVIEFGAAHTKTNAPSANDVRVFFAGRGRLTMRVERWDDLQMAGSNPYFGKARFLPWAFSAIQFNLDKQKPNTATPDPALNVPVSGLEGFMEN